MACPIPRLAPVTSAVLPFRSKRWVPMLFSPVAGSDIPLSFI
jgi:hypothetical protein